MELAKIPWIILIKINKAIPKIVIQIADASIRATSSKHSLTSNERACYKKRFDIVKVCALPAQIISIEPAWNPLLNYPNWARRAQGMTMIEIVE